MTIWTNIFDLININWNKKSNNNWLTYLKPFTVESNLTKSISINDQICFSFTSGITMQVIDAGIKLDIVGNFYFTYHLNETATTSAIIQSTNTGN